MQAVRKTRDQKQDVDKTVKSLEVKLSGRPEVPARAPAVHGPLQRLLEAMLRLPFITAFQGALNSLGLEGRPYLPGLFRRAIEP